MGSMLVKGRTRAEIFGRGDRRGDYVSIGYCLKEGKEKEKGKGRKDDGDGCSFPCICGGFTDQLQ